MEVEGGIKNWTGAVRNVAINTCTNSLRKKESVSRSNCVVQQWAKRGSGREKVGENIRRAR